MLTESDPGIYALEWKEAQSLRGLAIKEIDVVGPGADGTPSAGLPSPAS